MLVTNKISNSGDPSMNTQSFVDLKINILCCRYWWLAAWKGQSMSFPYWRLYWNKNKGAYIFYQQKIELLPGYIYI